MVSHSMILLQKQTNYKKAPLAHYAISSHCTSGVVLFHFFKNLVKFLCFQPSALHFP